MIGSMANVPRLDCCLWGGGKMGLIPSNVCGRWLLVVVDERDKPARLYAQGRAHGFIILIK